MSAWSRSADGLAATARIQTEITTRGWDQLGKSSPKNELKAAEDQRFQFIRDHLICVYPKACKDAQAWREFIRAISRKVRLCGSTSVAYQQNQNKTHKQRQTKQFVGSNVSMILTQRTCGQPSSMAVGRKLGALAFYFPIRFCYVFLISRCRGESDLDVRKNLGTCK